MDSLSLTICFMFYSFKMAMQYNITIKVMLLREVVGMNPYGYSRKRLLKLKQEDKPWDIITSFTIYPSPLDCVESRRAVEEAVES